MLIVHILGGEGSQREQARAIEKMYAVAHPSFPLSVDADSSVALRIFACRTLPSIYTSPSPTIKQPTFTQPHHWIERRITLPGGSKLRALMTCPLVGVRLNILLYLVFCLEY
jgi:hypothetical protein